MRNNFFWGASTSSHQIEGTNFNNWSVFEIENAGKMLARSVKNFSYIAGKRKLSKEIKKPSSYISGKGPDSYNLYKEDIKLLKKLGLNAYRFSIEWSRIEPVEGNFDKLQLKHYQNLVDELLENGIEPIVTLWHFSLPVWFEKQGGFSGVDGVKKFGRYCEFISKYLKGVKYFLTINEPNVYSEESFLYGNWPPQVKNPIVAYSVYQNLKLAHKLAYKKVKKHNPKAKVSFAHNVCSFEPHQNKFYNKFFCYIYSYFWNDDFVKSVRDELDFIGINFYFRNKISWGRIKNDNKRVSDLSWELKPDSLSDVLVKFKNYNLPILVTENGLADSNDKYRKWFIQKSIEALKRAKAAGANVFGYLYWSLIDNFEWDKGYWPKFGLASVNHSNKKRCLRKSSFFYAKIVKDNPLI